MGEVVAVVRRVVCHLCGVTDIEEDGPLDIQGGVCGRCCQSMPMDQWVTGRQGV